MPGPAPPGPNPNQRPDQHRQRKQPTGFRRVLRAGGHLLLLLGLPIESATGLPTQNDYQAQQPFSYQRTHDLKDQEVIFNPIGGYATDVTFLRAEIREPYTNIGLHNNQTEDFIKQLH